MPNRSQSPKRDGGGDARFDRGADFAIGGLPFLEIVGALRRAWAASTSYSPKVWSPKNPAWGQCAATALTLWRIYGGDILRKPVTSYSGAPLGVHYLNRLPDGTIVDMTWEQFPSDAIFSAAKKSRPHGEGVTLRADELLSRMKDQLAPLSRPRWGVQIRRQSPEL